MATYVLRAGSGRHGVAAVFSVEQDAEAQVVCSDCKRKTANASLDPGDDSSSSDDARTKPSRRAAEAARPQMRGTAHRFAEKHSSDFPDGVGVGARCGNH